MGGEEELKKLEVESPAETEKSPVESAAKDASTEEKKIDDSKALVLVDIVADSSALEKSSVGSTDRDVILARLETEKRLALIKAWEDSEKTKAENKAYRKLSSIGSWENTKKAAVEAKLKKIEEKLEKKKAEYAEKMKNDLAIIHKEAEEKRAHIESKRGEEIIKTEEIASKYRATGFVPSNILACFGVLKP